MGKRQITFNIWWPERPGLWGFLRRYLIPHPGTLIMTLLVVAGLLWATNAGALPQSLIPNLQPPSTGTIAYQGRLADADGNPLTGTYNMIFRLYDAASGGVPLWEEQWTGSNGVQVSDGLFNVMLGSLTQIPQSVIAGHDSLFLGITVGTDDEMTPRVQLGSVPFAMQALTVPDGSVTTAKIADEAVTQAKLGSDVSLEPPDGSITTAKIADGAVTSAKLNVDNSLGVVGNIELSTGSLEATNIAADGGLMRVTEGQIAIEQTSAEGNTRIFADFPPHHSWGIYHDNPDNIIHFTRRDGSGFETWSESGPGGNTTTTSVAQINLNNGSASFYGNLQVNGTKSALVTTEHHGRRKLYTFEQASNRFGDEGKARLVNGAARVNVDPIFLETIEGDFLIHVTPYGNAVLYVAEVGEDYPSINSGHRFVVRAREGRDDVAFAWMLTAARKGYAGVRLEEVPTTDDQKNADQARDNPRLPANLRF